MKRTAVLNVVGLTESLIGEHTPRIREFAASGAMTAITPAFPAVTCTAQSNYLTGTSPWQHGVVANGWFNRELSEVQFWKQSNHLVGGKKLWEDLREIDSTFTCAKLFWWFNMYSRADYSITPRPIYPADGRKSFDIYSWPYSIRDEIKKDLGEFPFATFWGPAAGISSPQGSADAASRWIAESAKWIESKFSPTLNLVYLPHLDYNLQRLGPFVSPASSGGSRNRLKAELQTAINPAIFPDLQQIDAIVGDLISFFQQRDVQVILLSEYGITNVDTPIHLNRLFRQQGWLTIKNELGREILDCGASKVFAVADHQVAHIYFNDRSLEKTVRHLLEHQRGIDSVLGEKEKAELGLTHPRAGDLIAVAEENAWFTYYYWLKNSLAPDFARTVDIHRKPGYDPAELFLDPKTPAVKLKILYRLLQKKLGFRMLMDVIPLDATLVKGSHGRRTTNPAEQAVFICERSDSSLPEPLDSTQVYAAIKRMILEG